MDEPGQVLGRAVGGVCGQPLGPEAEAVLRPLDHGARGTHLRLPDGAARLGIDNDGMIEVDQIVGGILGREPHDRHHHCEQPPPGGPV